jgi:hypothetical protein
VRIKKILKKEKNMNKNYQIQFIENKEDVSILISLPFIATLEKKEFSGNFLITASLDGKIKDYKIEWQNSNKPKNLKEEIIEEIEKKALEEMSKRRKIWEKFTTLKLKLLKAS